MTTPLQQKTVMEPDLPDVFSLLKQDFFASLNCVKIGRIQSFDGEKHTAQVQILFKRVLPDLTIKSYPLLVDVPVMTLQGGGGSLQFPITKGDQCLLLFSDRRLDEWFQTGGESAPGSPRLHDMSDAIAIVGVNALGGSLPDAPTNKVVLEYQGSKFEVTATGWNFVGDGGAEIDLAGEIITLKNNSTTLLTLLNGLITVIEGLQVNGPIPLTAASVAALEAQKTILATLLG